MTELTDERLAEMRADWSAPRNASLTVHFASQDILTCLDAFSRLRAENAALVAARAELVEGLRAFGQIAETAGASWRETTPLVLADRPSALTEGAMLIDCRRAAELVARHSP